MGSENLLEQVREWLEAGSPESDKIEDVPWEVEEKLVDGNKMLVAVNPLFPVPLQVFYDEESNIVRLVIETGIKTWFLDAKDRLERYRFLLRLNRMPLIKAYLFGDEDEIAVVGDLSGKTIGKEEFNDMLAFMLIAVMHLYKELGMPEEKKEESYLALLAVLSKWLKEGWPKSRLIRILERGGMPKEEASRLIEELSKALRGEKEAKSSLDFI